jgi:hypothetical protein
MATMEPETAFPEPWMDLRAGDSGKADQRDVLRTELAKELGVGHVLYGRAFSVAARSEANDDVLVTLDDGTWALVHLMTWQGIHARPPWPSAVFFSTMADAVAAIFE